MQIVVLGDEILKNELVATDADVIWINQIYQLQQHKEADAFIDLSFDNTQDRIDILKAFGKPVLINSVVTPLSEVAPSFVRINGWYGFSQSAIIEGSVIDESAKRVAEKVLQQFNKKIEWLPDEPGFVTARVISMIVNEAYFALSEGVSTKEEIDIAMKLGTNYPYGPFEWSKKIGLHHIAALLNKLSGAQKRYQPCALLLQEAAIS